MNDFAVYHLVRRSSDERQTSYESQAVLHLIHPAAHSTLKAWERTAEADAGYRLTSTERRWRRGSVRAATVQGLCVLIPARVHKLLSARMHLNLYW